MDWFTIFETPRKNFILIFERDGIVRSFGLTSDEAQALRQRFSRVLPSLRQPVQLEIVE